MGFKPGSGSLPLCLFCKPIVASGPANFSQTIHPLQALIGIVTALRSLRKIVKDEGVNCRRPVSGVDDIQVGQKRVRETMTTNAFASAFETGRSSAGENSTCRAGDHISQLDRRMSVGFHKRDRFQ